MPEVVLSVLGCGCSHLTKVAVQVLAATAGLQLIAGGQGRFLQLSHGQVTAVALALLVDGQLLLAGCGDFAGQAVKGVLLTVSGMSIRKIHHCRLFDKSPDRCSKALDTTPQHSVGCNSAKFAGLPPALFTLLEKAVPACLFLNLLQFVCQRHMASHSLEFWIGWEREGLT